MSADLIATLLGLVAALLLLFVARGQLLRYRELKRVQREGPAPADLQRLRAAPMPPDLLDLALTDRIRCAQRVRETSGLSLRDAVTVCDLARDDRW